VASSSGVRRLLRLIRTQTTDRQIMTGVIAPIRATSVQAVIRESRRDRLKNRLRMNGTRSAPIRADFATMVRPIGLRHQRASAV
jgi:hypothetical protein